MSKLISSDAGAIGNVDMQLASFEVRGLFHRLTHRIEFPAAPEGKPTPSIVILHGPNGMGKTTVLRMIDGLMTLNFGVFNEVPFEACELRFTTGEAISVEEPNAASRLRVRFRDRELKLRPRKQQVPGEVARDRHGSRPTCPNCSQCLRGGFGIKNRRAPIGSGEAFALRKASVGVLELEEDGGL